MEILPVNFGTEHKQMLSHLYLMINKGYLAIPEKYDKLIVSLRTATMVPERDSIYAIAYFCKPLISKITFQSLRR
jgi:hypothetical protein